MTHQTSTLSEDIRYQYNSSNESISSKSVYHGPKHKMKMLNNSHAGNSNSNTIPEGSKELRILHKPVSGQKINDDRLIMVSSKRVPFLIFSLIPYNKTQRAARYTIFNIFHSICLNLKFVKLLKHFFSGGNFRTEMRKDTIRRKNATGQRPLSSINDNLDLFGLLGLERAKDGQVKNEISKNVTISQREYYSKRFVCNRKFLMVRY